jgi:hypothetical protein
MQAMLALARASGGGDVDASDGGGWRLGTRPALDSSPAVDAVQLEVVLAEGRARVAAFEEEVLALEFAAGAPDGVAELPVTFSCAALQVGGW